MLEIIGAAIVEHKDVVNVDRETDGRAIDVIKETGGVTAFEVTVRGQMSDERIVSKLAGVRAAGDSYSGTEIDCGGVRQVSDTEALAAKCWDVADVEAAVVRLRELGRVIEIVDVNG